VSRPRLAVFPGADVRATTGASTAFAMRDIVRLCDLWRLTTQMLESTSGSTERSPLRTPRRSHLSFYEVDCTNGRARLHWSLISAKPGHSTRGMTRSKAACRPTEGVQCIGPATSGVGCEQSPAPADRYSRVYRILRSNWPTSKPASR
jgi:hypothetical protein